MLCGTKESGTHAGGTAQKVEGALQCAVDQAKAASIDLEELKEMLSLLYEE